MRLWQTCCACQCPPNLSAYTHTVSAHLAALLAQYKSPCFCTVQEPLLLQLHIEAAHSCMTLLTQCDTAAVPGSSSGRMSLDQISHAVTTSHWMWQCNSRDLQLRHKETKEETEEVIGST